MHIELIDLLRCPVDHEETWLVAAFTKLDGRDVVEGKLGCPICRAEYPIRNGIGYFGGEIAADESSEEVMMTAAFLDLTSPGKTVLLAGAFGNLSAEISDLA